MYGRPLHSWTVRGQLPVPEDTFVCAPLGLSVTEEDPTNLWLYRNSSWTDQGRLEQTEPFVFDGNLVMKVLDHYLSDQITY